MGNRGNVVRCVRLRMIVHNISCAAKANHSCCVRIGAIMTRFFHQTKAIFNYHILNIIVINISIIVMSLKVFVDHASQPSRAVLEFCLINKIPFELVDTRIAKADQKKPEFLKINPVGKVPAISHGDFNLAESHAIMRYLSRHFKTPQHWYPRQDLQKAAKIDQYLDFHHTGTRRCSYLFFNLAMLPAMGVPIPSTFNEQEARKEVDRNIKFINNVFLKDTPYLNSNEISIADLSAYNQLLQLHFLDYDFSKYSNIPAWFKRIESIKEVQEENKIFYKFLNAFKAKNKPKL